MTADMHVKAEPGDPIPPRLDCNILFAHGPHWWKGPLGAPWRCHGISAVDVREVLNDAASEVEATDPELAATLRDLAADYAGPYTEQETTNG